MRNKILILLLFIPFIVSAQDGYYFFTESEINNMRSAAKTEWGQKDYQNVKRHCRFAAEVPITCASIGRRTYTRLFFAPNTKYVFHSTGISRKHITVHNASIIGQGISVTTGHG